VSDAEREDRRCCGSCLLLPSDTVFRNHSMCRRPRGCSCRLPLIAAAVSAAADPAAGVCFGLRAKLALKAPGDGLTEIK